MKNKVKNNSIAGQSTAEVKKSQKHDVNLQKNSILYFQIGLILCLLGVFALFEMQFEKKNITPIVATIDNEFIDYQIDKVKVFTPNKKIEKKVEKQPTSEVLKDKFKEDDSPDSKDDLEKKLVTTDEQPNKGNTTGDDMPTIIEIPEEVHVSAVQFVPIFPGCEKFELNSERRKCLNDMMGKLVRKKFDASIAEDYNLKGVQRIFVEFKVNTLGEIVDIKTRAPHPKLEKEALRLAHKIPKMQPGKIGTTPVNVVYNLPIKFKVQD